MGGGLCVNDTNAAPPQLLHSGKDLAADDASSTVSRRDSKEPRTQTHTECHPASRHSLGCAEGRLKVLPAVAGAQGAVVEGVREEVVHQGAEGHAVAPAGREVLDVHMLGGRWEERSDGGGEE